MVVISSVIHLNLIWISKPPSPLFLFEKRGTKIYDKRDCSRYDVLLDGELSNQFKKFTIGSVGYVEKKS